MNFLQGFRTIIFNIVTAASSIVGAVYGLEITDEHQMAFCTTIIAAGNIILRLFTKTPIGKKDQIIIKKQKNKRKNNHVTNTKYTENTQIRIAKNEKRN